MGAVLHTLNIRLFPEQLAYVINHAEDKVVIVDDSLVPLLAKIVAELTTRRALRRRRRRRRVVARSPSIRCCVTTTLLAGEPTTTTGPRSTNARPRRCVTRREPRAIPKGVAYSHRCAFLHSLAAMTPNALGFSERDRILMIVPMFHANVWGIPYAAFMCGADLSCRAGSCRPSRSRAWCMKNVSRSRARYRRSGPTSSLRRRARDRPFVAPHDHLRRFGGAAFAHGDLRARYGVRIVQAWGMTETSPLAAVAHPPSHVEIGAPEEMDWRACTGRVVGGVELRIVDDQGAALPWDGEAVGEIEVRGPWITGAYYRDPSPEKFDNGWLRTGDVGSVSADGLRADHRPRQGRHQVGRRVDQLGRARRTS